MQSSKFNTQTKTKLSVGETKSPTLFCIVDKQSLIIYNSVNNESLHYWKEQAMTDYKKLCLELFGTDDEAELRKIAGRIASGRKKALSKQTMN